MFLDEDIRPFFRVGWTQVAVSQKVGLSVHRVRDKYARMRNKDHIAALREDFDRKYSVVKTVVKRG